MALIKNIVCRITYFYFDYLLGLLTRQSFKFIGLLLVCHQNEMVSKLFTVIVSIDGGNSDGVFPSRRRFQQARFGPTLQL